MLKKINAFIYDHTIGILNIYYIKLCRSISYAVFGWNNKDFDDGFLLQLEVYKLKRMLHLFKNYGNHCEDCENYKPKMKSIKLAIKLGERVINHNYRRFYDMHVHKYGKIQYEFEPTDATKQYYQMILIKNNKKYERTQDEIDDLINARSTDEREQGRDRRLFYRIIEKYGRYWWD